MSSKATGLGLLVVGVLLILISATADAIGLGGAPGFGWKQGAAMVVGVVLGALGMLRLRAHTA
jgi:hypothetical protein